MANISKFGEPSADQKSSVGTQEATRADGSKQESGGIGGAEIPPRSNGNDKTSNYPKDPYERWRTVVSALALVVSGLALAVSCFSVYLSKRSATAAEQSAAAAQRNAATAEGAFRLTQQNARPWVSVEPSLTQPVTFDEKGNLPLEIDLGVKNVGNAVALDTRTWADMFILDPDGQDTIARQKQGEQCEIYRFPTYSAQDSPGITLYPGLETVHLSINVGKWAKEIRRELARALPSHKGKVGFAIAGCVSYRAAFEDHQTSRHQTRFLYYLGRRENGESDYFMKPQGSPEDIVLLPMTYGNSAD
jgi:hypothetical protein